MKEIELNKRVDKLSSTLFYVILAITFIAGLQLGLMFGWIDGMLDAATVYEIAEIKDFVNMTVSPYDMVLLSVEITQ